MSKSLPNRRVWALRFTAARRKHLPLSQRAPGAETHCKRLLSLLQVRGGRPSAGSYFIFLLKCPGRPVNTERSNGAHTLRRENAGRTLGTRGKGGTERNRFQEGRRPTIIGAEQRNETFGAANLHAASRRSLFSSQTMASKLEECGSAKTENLDQVAAQAQG